MDRFRNGSRTQARRGAFTGFRAGWSIRCVDLKRPDLAGCNTCRAANGQAGAVDRRARRSTGDRLVTGQFAFRLHQRSRRPRVRRPLPAERKIAAIPRSGYRFGSEPFLVAGWLAARLHSRACVSRRNALGTIAKAGGRAVVDSNVRDAIRQIPRTVARGGGEGQRILANDRRPSTAVDRRQPHRLPLGARRMVAPVCDSCGRRPCGVAHTR